MTLDDERYSVGLPDTNAKLLAGNVTHATMGDPAALRHVRQWHRVALLGGPSAR